MKKMVKKIIALALGATLSLSALAGCTTQGGAPAAGGAEAPLKFTMTYSDNPTLPFREDWLVNTESEARYNLDITWEIIPSTDYTTKINAELATGTGYDVITYLGPSSGDQAALALSGAIAPISDYVDMGWAPNFARRIEEWNMQDELDQRRLSDGKYYFLPALFDKQFYDGGLILRDDLLEKFGMEAPTTFDEFYEYLKACKEDNPESFPLTNLVGPQVTYRMSMPSFGMSVGRNASTGTWVLSWNYDNEEYFTGAIDDSYKAYLEYFAKLYAEGLYDPEFLPEGDMWAIKMSTGAAVASYAYYDQIGGLLANSEVEGISFNMVPPLEGPGGAYHQPKARLSAGVVFTAAAQERDDFEQLVRAIDNMFYSDEAAELWSIGKEGVTFTKNSDGSVEFIPEATGSVDGVYKYLQVNYGTGSASSQMVWINEQEMLKYDENYAAINAVVAEMDGVPLSPPTPVLSEDNAERASLLQAALRDAFEIWNNDFITGAKSLETDWDAYVQEMKDKGIEELCQIYNDSRR
ncbi:MAG: extracellular solute-binding protein [Clostridiales bacterium]|jgi:putative aldouronate transport system substrate-binding protein|nr:extracellular solute-binding protein [Clostridiales bacterium]